VCIRASSPSHKKTDANTKEIVFPKPHPSASATGQPGGNGEIVFSKPSPKPTTSATGYASNVRKGWWYVTYKKPNGREFGDMFADKASCEAKRQTMTGLAALSTCTQKQ
jgi:hypothetical protein